MKDLEILYNSLEKYIEAQDCAFNKYREQVDNRLAEVEAEVVKYDGVLNLNLLTEFRHSGGSLTKFKAVIEDILFKQYLKQLREG